MLSFDVVIHFNLGFYKPNGVLVCEREDILKHYISSWFVFDVLAAIPWSLLSLSFLRMDPFFSRFQVPPNSQEFLLRVCTTTQNSNACIVCKRTI